VSSKLCVVSASSTADNTSAEGFQTHPKLEKLQFSKI